MIRQKIDSWDSKQTGPQHLSLQRTEILSLALVVEIVYSHLYMRAEVTTLASMRVTMDPIATVASLNLQRKEPTCL